MLDWPQSLTQAHALVDHAALDACFAALAARLLAGAKLHVRGEPHQLVEIEFYYHSATHPDPFTHGEPLQQECGRWHFHRTRGSYRGGSFKGLDLTFGTSGVYGGILIRGLQAPDGTRIDGPSLCVDYLLTKTGTPNVAALDNAIACRLAWDTQSPLALVEIDAEESTDPLRSARVGLSLKRATNASLMPLYLLRRYRYLRDPRRIGKGKLHVVLALHAAGLDAGAIGKRTGCPRRTVDRYIAEFEIGRREVDFTPYFGTDLTPRQLCRLHGAWHTRFGADPGIETIG
ncbi:MAG: hypothetical protein K2R98_28830 [Gemmataceae bacterium]|nr:hypothetical protein [Gemmataceae bacterium]